MSKVNLKKWHKMVCERDGYICQVCHKDFSYPCYFLPDGRNSAVGGDHILTQGAHPEHRLDVSNGRCICVPCHNSRHSKGFNQENA